MKEKRTFEEEKKVQNSRYLSEGGIIFLGLLLLVPGIKATINTNSVMPPTFVLSIIGIVLILISLIMIKFNKRLRVEANLTSDSIRISVPLNVKVNPVEEKPIGFDKLEWYIMTLVKAKDAEEEGYYLMVYPDRIANGKGYIFYLNTGPGYHECEISGIPFKTKIEKTFV